MGSHGALPAADAVPANPTTRVPPATTVTAAAARLLSRFFMLIGTIPFW